MEKRREPFKTPKKAAIFAAGLVFAVAVLAAAMLFSASAVAKRTSIGEEKAENFAFADLGIDPLSAEGLQTRFDFKQGQFVYQVCFTADGTEYEYWIKASDGSVVKKGVDLVAKGEGLGEGTAPITLDRAKEVALSEQADGAGSGQEAQGKKPGDGQISLEDAKGIALSDAGLSSGDVAFTKAKLDYEDGIAVYDIEFYTASHEYEYEVNASTGGIRSKDKEILEGREDSGNAGDVGNIGNPGAAVSDIGVDQAKYIAASHAGLPVSDVAFSKVKLEKEDGVAVYEIDFYRNGIEYEYEINAVTGEIIKYESEQEED